jgi:hypothetical protein
VKPLADADQWQAGRPNQQPALTWRCSTCAQILSRSCRQPRAHVHVTTTTATSSAAAAACGLQAGPARRR